MFHSQISPFHGIKMPDSAFFAYYYDMGKRYLQPIIHLSFWVFIFIFILDYFWVDDDIGDALICTSIECLFYAATAYINLYLLIPLVTRNKWEINFWVYVPLASVLIAVVVLLFWLSGVEMYLYGEETIRAKASFGITLFMIVLFSFLFSFVGNYHRSREEALLLKQQKLEAEMSLLKSQVSPHFLFNSFNNMFSLAVQKSDDAPRFIDALAQILRYLIYEGSKERVPLKKELELIERYFELERLKKTPGFERIRYTHEGLLQQQMIAPLLVINIVENTIKHGDIVRPDGYIHIETRVDESQFEINASNTTKQKKIGSGIGLTNLRRQLELHYPERHELRIELKEKVFSLHLRIDL